MSVSGSKDQKQHKSLAGVALGALLTAGLMAAGAPDVAQAKSNEQEVVLVSHYFKMSPLVVNVQTMGRRSAYLKVAPVLVTTRKSVYQQLREHEPLVRSTLLSLYSKSSVDELLATGGLDDLRQRTIDELRILMRPESGDDAISNVLFTEFVVQ
ncbi:MAG: flagellar basal body-associated FliL family protein [Endozoicomonas sp.]